MATSDVLTAEHLDLQPFGDRFLTDRYVGWLNDSVTVRYSEQRHRTHTVETCRAYAQSFEGGPSYFWAIVVRDVSLGHIGNITATIDAHNRVADLAIMVGEASARGRGYGLEAWQRACQFLLNEGRMRKVTAGTMATNEPMLRLMRTSGMIEEGRRKRQLLVSNSEVDIILTALFAT
jgi:RimJ/RimL family protein N-acetyltransferase